MHGLQVRRHEVCVPSHHLQRCVTENLLEMKQTPASPQVFRGECVPGSVNGSPRGREANPVTQALNVPEDVPLTQFPALLCAEDELLGMWAEIEDELGEHAAQLH